MSKNVPATWPGHKTKTKIKQIQSDARLGCNVSLNRLVTLGYDTGQLGTRLVSHLDAVLLVDLHARGCGLDFSSERKVGFTENTARNCGSDNFPPRCLQEWMLRSNRVYDSRGLWTDAEKAWTDA